MGLKQKLKLRGCSRDERRMEPNGVHYIEKINVLVERKDLI